MLTQNDLLLIEEVLDRKLENKLDDKLAPIHQDIAAIKGELSATKSIQVTMQSDLSEMRDDLKTVQLDIDTLNSTMTNLRVQVYGHNQQLESMHKTLLRVKKEQLEFYNFLQGENGMLIKRVNRIDEHLNLGPLPIEPSAQ